MHRDGGNAELLACPQHAQGNFTAVGYEDFVEHVVLGGRVANKGVANRVKANSPLATRHSPYSMIIIGSPNSTGWPSSMRICMTVPVRGDGIWFIVFIASMMSSVCPAETLLPTSTNGLAPGSGDQ